MCCLCCVSASLEYKRWQTNTWRTLSRRPMNFQKAGAKENWSRSVCVIWYSGWLGCVASPPPGKLCCLMCLSIFQGKQLLSDIPEYILCGILEYILTVYRLIFRSIFCVVFWSIFWPYIVWYSGVYSDRVTVLAPSVTPSWPHVTPQTIQTFWEHCSRLPFMCSMVHIQKIHYAQNNMQWPQVTGVPNTMLLIDRSSMYPGMKPTGRWTFWSKLEFDYWPSQQMISHLILPHDHQNYDGDDDDDDERWWWWWWWFQW